MANKKTSDTLDRKSSQTSSQISILTVILYYKNQIKEIKIEF